MAKWIADDSVLCREIAGTRVEKHNSLSGVPTFSVQLEIPNGSLESAISSLLGNPESWPYDTVFSEVRAIGIDVVADKGAYAADADQQLTYYTNPHLINVTYAARHGYYHEGATDDDDLYIDDTVDSRVESKPLDFNQLIWGTTDPDTLPNKQQTVQAGIVPSKYENGEQLVHYIEGWVTDTEPISAKIGTTNDTGFVSISLGGRLFPQGTLLLRNVIIAKVMTYKSYRQPPATLSGQPTFIVKCIYEYKSIGWSKFWRIYTEGGPDLTGYYYIRQKASPHDRVDPFPEADHSAWLF